MVTKTINIRDLTRNIKQVTSAIERGERLTVLRHAKPVFEITPILDSTDTSPSRFDFSALKKLQFKTGRTNASRHIDEIMSES